MQDFSAELRDARAGMGDQSRSVPMGVQDPGGFGRYLVQRATSEAFGLGFEAGRESRNEELADRVEAARLRGFDSGVRVLLTQTLRGLQEVVGELESRRAHKVMNERTRERLDELIAQLATVGALLPPLPMEQMAIDNIVAGTVPFNG
jgi:hypothetical protein